jgi:hypothetical protein
MVVIIILGSLKVLSNEIVEWIVVYIYIAEIWNTVVCSYQCAIW